MERKWNKINFLGTMWVVYFNWEVNESGTVFVGLDMVLETSIFDARTNRRKDRTKLH